MKKEVTHTDLTNAFQDYIEQLADNKKISESKYNHMQTAIVGCMYLVDDLFGKKRHRKDATVKSSALSQQ